MAFVIIQLYLWYYSAIRGGCFLLKNFRQRDAMPCGCWSLWAQHLSSGTGDAQGNRGSVRPFPKKYLLEADLRSWCLSQAGILPVRAGHQARRIGLAIAPEKLFRGGNYPAWMEGSLAPVACRDFSSTRMSAKRCKTNVRTLFVWEGLDRVIQSYLEGITLQDALAHPLP